jgi:hypothetical protein
MVMGVELRLRLRCLQLTSSSKNPLQKRKKLSFGEAKKETISDYSACVVVAGLSSRQNDSLHEKV